MSGGALKTLPFPLEGGWVGGRPWGRVGGRKGRGQRGRGHALEPLLGGGGWWGEDRRGGGYGSSLTQLWRISFRHSPPLLTQPE